MKTGIEGFIEQISRMRYEGMATTGEPSPIVSITVSKKFYQQLEMRAGSMAKWPTVFSMDRNLSHMDAPVEMHIFGVKILKGES